MLVENANDNIGLVHAGTSVEWESPLVDEYRLTCPGHTYVTHELSCREVEPYFTYSTKGPPYSFAVATAATPGPLFTCE